MRRLYNCGQADHFPGYSSPANHYLPPGAYFMNGVRGRPHRREGHVDVGKPGQPQPPIDLPVPTASRWCRRPPTQTMDDRGGGEHRARGRRAAAHIELSDRWSCHYVGKRVIVGDTRTEPGAAFARANPNAGCDDTIFEFVKESIWNDRVD